MWEPPYQRSTPDLNNSDGWDNEGFVSPYQPTPENYINVLIKHLSLDPKKDVFLDAGCGDGEVVLAVAKHFKNVQCLGVDLDESLINKAQQKAMSKNISNTEFIIQNFTSKDADCYSKATVLFAYLIPEGLDQLRQAIIYNNQNNSCSIQRIITFWWKIPNCGIPQNIYNDVFFEYSLNSILLS